MSIRKRRSDRSGRAPLPSPGRPPVAGRDEAASVLAGNRSGNEQRGCCGRGRCVAACRNQMVPKGRRHAPSDVQILGEAALRAIPVVGGARGDRASAGPGPFHAGDRAPARAIRLDDLP